MKKLILGFAVLFSLAAIDLSALNDEYLIGEEDVLQISVWDNPNLSVVVPVRPDGMISLPLAGDVKASGISPQDLKKRIEKELGRYMKVPVVSVIVTAVNSFKVYVFGDGFAKTSAEKRSGDTGSAAASVSGQITLRRNTTLFQFLIQTGSLGNIDAQNAYIVRDGKKLAVDFEQLLGNGDFSQDIKLVANDIIYLPGGFNNRIRIAGEVKTPCVIPYAESMTALDAVLSAGGFTDFASRNSVLIVRKEGKNVKIIEVKIKDVINGAASKNIFLKPGDIVTVKQSWF
ncbi:MAG: sugar ABC transporter substrate-binding protein [Desulfobacteraceae bacterium]|nr:MAG: sugar ABC transporter substrate-binding protein [Desulfobacteraceae bacterium]